MSEIDKIKEEIGWLKIVFGILLVTDISFVGRIARNMFNMPVFLFLAAIIMGASITWVIIMINRHVYGKLEDLGDL